MTIDPKYLTHPHFEGRCPTCGQECGVCSDSKSGTEIDPQPSGSTGSHTGSSAAGLHPATSANEGSTPSGSSPSVHDFVSAYEFTFEDSNTYRPNERERSMIEDAIEGFLAANPVHSSGDENDTTWRTKAFRFQHYLRRVYSAAIGEPGDFAERILKIAAEGIDTKPDELMACDVPERWHAPGGWKLVPVEPTESMLDAGRDAMFTDLARKHGLKIAHAGYRAMLSAVSEALPPPTREAHNRRWNGWERINAIEGAVLWKCPHCKRETWTSGTVPAPCGCAVSREHGQNESDDGLRQALAQQETSAPGNRTSPGVPSHDYKAHERDANRCALCDYQPGSECHNRGLSIVADPSVPDGEIRVVHRGSGG